MAAEMARLNPPLKRLHSSLSMLRPESRRSRFEGCNPQQPSTSEAGDAQTLLR